MIRQALVAGGVALTLLAAPLPAQADIGWYGGWCDAWSGGVHIKLDDGVTRPYARGSGLQECHGSVGAHGVRAELQYWLPNSGRWVRLGYGRWKESYGPSDVMGPISAKTDIRYCVSTKETRFRVRVQQWAKDRYGNKKSSTHNGRSSWLNCGQPGS